MIFLNVVCVLQEAMKQLRLAVNVIVKYVYFYICVQPVHRDTHRSAQLQRHSVLRERSVDFDTIQSVIVVKDT